MWLILSLIANVALVILAAVLWFKFVYVRRDRDEIDLELMHISEELSWANHTERALRMEIEGGRRNLSDAHTCLELLLDELDDTRKRKKFSLHDPLQTALPLSMT